MKKRIVIVFIAWLPFITLAKSGLTPAELEAKAQAFIDAKNARQQPETKLRDIEHFISLLCG